MIDSQPSVPPWLTAARMGCRDALGRAFQACRRYLLRIAREELPPELQEKGSASDLVQEAFLEAAHDFPQFRGESEVQFRAWMRQVLRRRIAKFGRRYFTTKKRAVMLERSRDNGLSSFGRKQDVPADLPTPSAQIMEEERSQALQQALKQLPDDYRRVLQLRYQEERSFEEIGPLMQRTPNAARLLWLRAIERVKHELKVAYEP
jgi:RNA polymerase sigma-70 factor (ECF subfamily)